MCLNASPLPLARASLLNLPGRVEAEIGMARALVGKLTDAEHPGLERGADRVEEDPERRMVGELPGRPAGRADAPEVGEIRFDRLSEFRAGYRHRPFVAQRGPTRKRDSAPPRFGRNDRWGVPRYAPDQVRGYSG